MQVRILKKTFGGVEFGPENRVLHLGGQNSAGVEKLTFVLPEEWEGKSVALHIKQMDGTLPTPILLDETNSVTVGKEFTASTAGLWMLLALGADRVLCVRVAGGEGNRAERGKSAQAAANAMSTSSASSGFSSRRAPMCTSA